jgi:excisionase family DNA binding protein
MAHQGHAGALRLAFNKTEAAQVLGISVDFFDAHVAHELRCVRRGRRRLYPLAELNRWLEQSAERAAA